MMICRWLGSSPFRVLSLAVRECVYYAVQSKKLELKNDGKTKLIGNLIPSGDAYTMFIIFTHTHPQMRIPRII